MTFCPKCGAPLKVKQPPAEALPQEPYRVERPEKHEKEEKERHEKMEKEERYERRELEYMGSLIGGLVLMFFGLMFYLTLTSSLRWETAWAFFFVIIGIVIIVGAVYAAMKAARRHPQT